MLYIEKGCRVSGKCMPLNEGVERHPSARLRTHHSDQVTWGGYQRFYVQLPVCEEVRVVRWEDDSAHTHLHGDGWWWMMNLTGDLGINRCTNVGLPWECLSLLLLVLFYLHVPPLYVIFGSVWWYVVRGEIDRHPKIVIAPFAPVITLLLLYQIC